MADENDEQMTFEQSFEAPATAPEEAAPASEEAAPKPRRRRKTVKAEAHPEGVEELTRITQEATRAS